MLMLIRKPGAVSARHLRLPNRAPVPGLRRFAGLALPALYR